MNLNQVTIPSLDVTKSITFYQKLGLHLIVHTHERYARFECPDGESTFSIHQVEELPSGDGVVVYFETKTLDEDVSRLRENGITFDLLPTDQSWLWREARLKDPDGNQLILFFGGDNRKNPPWRIGNEISTKAEIKAETTEIERKFLLTSDAFKKEASRSFRITQGYLTTDIERTVRVRIKGDKAYLTIKGKSNEGGTTRVEVEEEIAFAKAETLLKLCLPGVIDKTRYEVNIGNHTWEIDEFYGENKGLFLAEIELKNEEESFQKPAWVGKEVTGNKKYYNSYISTHPYTLWE
ncbi:CYTH domain-containing protein [Dokdonia sp.]|uniref:CYTH domain-containing protein n=1 Tax=Dokdonia sp. TaxID=2024995 RepID=UPI0032648027